ncbi:ArnT family glycosyltransferase [Aliterella atlantica]|uniref:Glycosyltransferase n=1 Tax=Aliterella atlantica CENA595 TaxID=1618023 RepID=A0A0D8ZVZ7_9CYAN|nr:glycosyltransferase family 39 protein [Aliterella atlantica]KJH71396.1 glycosyltransferase [Aliterella atlantica CENA595]
MHRLQHKWTRQSDRQLDLLCICALLLAALLIFTINLGSLPLRDWDEGTVAQVAREIARTPIGSDGWLYPTSGGESYLNKPPLMHWLIALTYRIGGVNEWTSRLPGAILTAISVPLLYTIGREIFPQRTTAIFASLVYLTMLPVVRHGRLAMLDGAVLCFFILTILCVLRSRRNLRYCLGVGIGFGLICFTKGLLGVLLGAIALLFLVWDTPRLLSSGYLWRGIAIGCAPVICWYVAQWLHYGNLFTDRAIVQQSLSRIWQGVENHTQPPWYYLLEIIKYSFPWLLFLPSGLKLIWQNRNLSYSKLILVWLGVYSLAISAMTTKLPWYVLPVYPAFALAVGVQLTEFWHISYLAKYPRAITLFLALLAGVGWFGSLYFSDLSPAQDRQVQLILVAVAATMTLAAILVAQSDRQFILVLFWGCYLALTLLMTSRHWVWELAEAYPVKPVAALVQSHTPVGAQIYTSYPYNRPALNFYSDRQISPASQEQLQLYWQQQKDPYFLLDQPTLKSLQLKSLQQLGTTTGWTLVKRQSSNSSLPNPHN